MRKALEDLINNTIMIEYTLPDKLKGIDKSNITNDKDYVYLVKKDEDLAKIIYNGIVEYANNENTIDYDNLEKEFIKTLESKVRYDKDASEEEKLKYGFFGEVLLDLLLRVFFQTKVIIARGYFYNILDNREVSGFDAYHMIENDKLELWLGEAKFYQMINNAIESVIKNVNYVFSEKYIKNNIIALQAEEIHFSNNNSNLERIINNWKENPEINIYSEIVSNNIVLVYPVFIFYELSKNKEEQIKKAISKINELCEKYNVSIPKEIEIKIFFAFIPVGEVSKTKKKVLEWIESKEQLI